MKFGEALNAQLQPEWRSEYFQYETAKKMLYNFKDNVPVQDDEQQTGDIALAICQFESQFFEFAIREVKKINNFFLEKLNEARRKYEVLVFELDEFFKYEQERKMSSGRSKQKLTTALRKSKDIHDFKMAFSEFYYSLILLQTYQQLNLTAFRKILKKHDKMLMTDDGKTWRDRNVVTAEFVGSKAADDLLAEVESVVTEKLEKGDHKRAMKMLRVAPVGQRPISPWAVFRVGMWCGYFLLLMATTMLLLGWFNCEPGHRGCWRMRAFARNETGDYLAEDVETFWLITIRLFRGIFLLGFFVILIGVNVHGWRLAGINHILLLDLDPRDNAEALAIAEVGLIILVTSGVSLFIWLMQFFLAYVADIPLLAIRLLSLSYLTFLVLFLVNPFPIFMSKTRFWLLKSLMRVFFAPCYTVQFADYFIAEQLISIAVMFQDLAFISCCGLFSFRPNDTRLVCNSKQILVVYGFLGCAPFWFRLAQCVRAYRDGPASNKHPQLSNAVKYSIHFFFVLFRSLTPFWQMTADNIVNPFHLTAMILGVVAFIYWYVWDTTEDWKVISVRNRRIRYLREQLIYRHIWYYYLAIAADFLLLAIVWLSQVFDLRLAYGQHTLKAELIVTVAAVCEVFRRFMWNFFRLECQHLFHPVKMPTSHSLIPHHSMKPLLHEEMKKVDRMMIEEDGVNVIRQERRRHMFC